MNDSGTNERQLVQRAVQRPILVVGFVGVTLPMLGRFLPDDSVVYVDEPDVSRKRGLPEKVAEIPFVRNLIEWEYGLPGKADEFFHAHPDLRPLAVVPAVEYATPFVARLAERYGLPGAGLGAAELMRDKALLRQVTAAAGILNPASARVRDVADVRAFLHRHPGPVVLKPANRQASVGTQVVRDPEQLEAAWASCQVQDEGIFTPDRPFEPAMLAEQYVDGEEFSVEALVRDGQPLFANVTGKQLFPGPRPVERAHIVPADLDAARSRRLVAATEAVLAATGFRDGVVHCEWILSGERPYLVECAGRMPGDGIVDAIDRAWSVELLRAYYDLLAGRSPAPLPDEPAGAAAVRFLLAGPGTVTGVQGVDEAAGSEGVFLAAVTAQPGDRLAELRSSWDRCGIVMAAGENPRQALRRADAAADLISLDIQLHVQRDEQPDGGAEVREHPSPGTLLVIGSGLKTYREYLIAPIRRRAQAAGLEMVLLNNLNPTWQRDYFDEIVVANLFDSQVLRDTARAVASRRRVVALMCWDEPLVLDAGLLAAEFGVPGLSAAGVRGCRDKQRTRQALTEAGLHQPRFELTTTVEEALVAAGRIGYPVILKPRAMGASIGVVLAQDESQLREAFRVARSASEVDPGPYRASALVEEYADGPEISIDGAVHAGEYLPMFVARKHSSEPPWFEEVGHLVDAADPLLGDLELISVLARAHKALGIEDGITHTEVRLTDRGPLIIEVNGRLGGDLIPFLGRVATGIEPGEVLFDVSTGARPRLDPARRRVAGIRFGYPEKDCVLRAVHLPQSAPGLVKAAPMAQPGTTLRLPPGGYLARHSFVVCSADDPQTCLDRLDGAAAAVRLESDPVGPPERKAAFEMPAGLLDHDE